MEQKGTQDATPQSEGESGGNTQAHANTNIHKLQYYNSPEMAATIGCKRIRLGSDIDQ